MARVAHIRNGEIIKTYEEGEGLITFEDGDRWQTAVLGTWGNDKVVPIETVTNDTSTIPETVRTRTIVVEADRVLITNTIRDMTAQELDEKADQEIEEQFQRDLKNWALEITNRVLTLEGNQPVTMAQLGAFVKGLRN